MPFISILYMIGIICMIGVQYHICMLGIVKMGCLGIIGTMHDGHYRLYKNYRCYVSEAVGIL